MSLVKDFAAGFGLHLYDVVDEKLLAARKFLII